MSYEAMRWAMGQPVSTALTKFLLVAMAECVNSEAGAMECWPSYAFLARRTGMNTKTVEGSVSRLKDEGFIVDTGKREGNTGKVVVYRLNDPTSGVIQPGPRNTDASGTRPHNTPEVGAIGAAGNPPNSDANPPKNIAQSPQKVEVTTPKTGDGIGNGIRKRTRKESGSDAPVSAIDGVSPELLTDWLAVRKAKRAGPITATVIQGLTREAAKAGVTVSEAVQFCCEVGWQGFNGGWYLERKAGGRTAGKTSSRHSGFQSVNYLEGATDGIPDA